MKAIDRLHHAASERERETFAVCGKRLYKGVWIQSFDSFASISFGAVRKGKLQNENMCALIRAREEE